MSQDTAGHDPRQPRRLGDISNSQGSNSSNSSSGSGKTLSLAEYTRRMRSTDAEWAAQARAAGLHLRPSPEVVVEEEEENEDDISRESNSPP